MIAVSARLDRRRSDVGILDNLFGRNEDPKPSPVRQPGATSTQSGDEQAIERYRYMLKTAPPETIEQAHAEAFAKLTPQQRTMLLQQLSAELPEAERAAGAAKDDPQSLARLATRAEVRQPGTMERTFGGMGGRGMGMGGMMAGSFLSTIAGVVVGSAIAQAFLGDSGAAPHDAAQGEDSSGDMSDDASADAGGDFGDFDGGDGFV
jgi:hypothetical protein